ncbi:laminin subunit alpha-2 isoform B [Alligator mississippiensis]|uniref:Laminin subunit alpha-2 isoform B n=1 Tax=Alligator mississippiensis TaxID=8496 RepID=A0A151PGY1_ALLMI|nr:laminin subunit alpha-2 isoform B [Alligator mississippiensis]
MVRLVSLHPPYFNLAATAGIGATATCGEDEGGRPRPELYCKLVGGPAAAPAIQGQFCDYCNAADPNKAHPITNAVDGTEQWWQSPPLSLGFKYNEVNVTLDLGQLFHVAYILIKFANSPRPDLWVLERSVDFGGTYIPWQYFAHSKADCLERFGKEANAPIRRDDDVLCTMEYSRIVPLENGEIVVSLINGRPGAKNFTYSPTLREFTKATNIRLHFLRTNTLLGHLISKAQRDPTVTRRYYYSIKDISVGGRCVCYGHAEVCDAKNVENLYQFQCQCQHNTCGETCNRCCPGYNQKQWQPATADNTNECESCNCHGHATDCYYDPDVDRHKGSLNIYGQYEGGGVCINCQHNTAGINCEQCAKGYYRPYGIPVEAPNGCIPCSCNPEYSSGCEEGSGRCHCKQNYRGESCEQCAEGYYDFPLCVRIPIYTFTTPIPEDPLAGHIIGGCKPGFFGPQCQPCQCYGSGVLDGDCDGKTGQCRCRAGFQGFSCDTCAVGYFHYPVCQMCECNSAGVLPEICNSLGKCLCRFEVGGPQCDNCHPGYHSFPTCQECSCNALGSVDNRCGRRGQCQCHPNYAGLRCDQCAPGYYSYPSCLPCQCSPHGSYHGTCEPATGQCECRIGITGQKCDRCLSGAYNFPYCQGASSDCDPTGTLDSHFGYCQCLQHVEGPACTRCKPLYWNLARQNPDGCIGCHCDVTGTLSGVGECRQEDGQCYCKPNVCGDSCDTCEAGYYALENRNYFGCQGCQCDVGGSVSPMCSEPSGACQCRKHIVGLACQEPEKNYFFPDLHHMKFEIEDGTTLNGRGIRFGYDPQEFPNFSWRGYAWMSSIQKEVRIILNVEKSNLYLFRIILRYINPGTEMASGCITAYQFRPETGATQSKEIVFPPSKEPAFVSVPGNSFAETFSLIPGTWIVNIMAEGVLLDYMVLLPSDYYEASVLQLQVTEPCTYSRRATRDNCLLYQHLPLDRFSCVLSSEATYFMHGGEYRKIAIHQPTPEHPVMLHIYGREIDLQLILNIPQVGRYAVVLEYANEDDQLYTANVIINSPEPVMEARVNIYSCKYSFLCRSVVVDNMNRIAVFDLLADAKLHLMASSINFLLHKICIIPAEEFSLEYVDPEVRCIATYQSFLNQSASCIPSVYGTPPMALLLDTLRDGKISEVQRSVLYDPLSAPLPSANTVKGVTLTSVQNQITLSGRVPHVGRYVFVIHFYQPDHPTFPVEVLVDGGHPWSGFVNALFCPHAFGCRDQVIAENQIELDIPGPDISVTLKIPNGKTLVLEHVLVIPADSYSPNILQIRTVDKSFDFINQCGGNSFYIDPVTSPSFCKDSMRSLVAFYNNGALLCNCHRAGSISPTCNPWGGQCDCKPNIIGRQCSRCQTGYYGFPFCKLCNCGRRLCDDITGKCICPPQTVKPKCEVCEKQFFSYHPVVGCESCNCSSKGVVNVANPECDKNSGQCKCRAGITGRQCDRCAPGSYGFPDCVPCNCNRDGTEPNVCDPQMGVCLCKENVEGVKCSICRQGSFYLNPSNPKGCTSCFCFGATNNCRSTSNRRTKFSDMRNWRLETMDNKIDVPVTFNPGSNSVVADVQELPPSVHSLYWIAPQSYLGEKLSSYGGYLSYQVKSFGLPSEGMVLLDKRPDVQLTGLQIKIVYVDPNNPLPDRQYYGRVQLLEGNFRHASSNNHVSREELMMVLSRLDGLHIRGLYFTETQRLTLGEVGLEEATSTGSGSIAYNVETCSCPPEYVGDSCQECSSGFYRENKGLFTGRCVPCSCNGNSNRCQDGSGICINCQHNTAGEKCERCKEGYFGDATQGSCRVCPCPYTNSFATGCVANGEEVQCLCKKGYSGINCESCAPGYFGNPLKYGGYCQKCNCNNNGQLMSCDRLTGECLNHEPKDVDPNEDCDTCDSCVITLLKDLDTMGDELLLIKSQLQNVNSSVHALEQMRRLETRIKDLRTLLHSYRSVVLSQGSKVADLDMDFIKLNQDINDLQEKAEINYRKAEVLFNNFGETNQRGKDLLSKVQIAISNIQVLLEQIASMNRGDNTLPFGDATEEQAEAEQMMREMRSRNFGQLQIDAERERREAQLLLERVRKELQKHQQENNGLIKIVRDSLNEYESKLSDLQEALNEANGQTKQAQNLNRENGVLLESIKKRIAEMNRQQNDILDLLRSTQSSVTQTNSIFGLLQKSKEEYDILAAKLDGARKDLNEKLKNHSLSASKEPLVVRAEEHAKFLQDLARQLDEIKRNASNDKLVSCAMEAATAYENIINAVQAAEEAAIKAKNAADSALLTVEREDLAGKATKLKAESSTLLNQAQVAQRTLQDINPTLEDVKKRLGVVEGKKSTLLSDLLTSQSSLSGINRDDIDSAITQAKNMVKNATDVTTSVLDELNPIKADVEKIKGSYGSKQTTDFNKALTEANNSVMKLTSKLPDLFNKIESINQQLMPIGNISDNVYRIRELIQQARDAANKVAIPMRFNGHSGVEVRAPSNLDDLKGYTSLSFFLQRPRPRLDTTLQSSNMFVMYLGNKDASKDYIGMAVRYGRLICVYNLGGNEAEIEVDPSVTESNPEEAILDRVKFERIYQFAKLNYVKAATAMPKDKGNFDSSSDNSHTLLNLDPGNVVFYIGGYPRNFTPPRELDHPYYEGCIELDSLNENMISLYNFRRTFNLNTTEVRPCRRYREESDQIYFEGTGYARVTQEQNRHSRIYEQTIQTTSDEGIVFFAENQDHFISVIIENGHLVFRYKLDSEPAKEIARNTAVVNDGTYQQIKLYIIMKNVQINSNIKVNVSVFQFATYYLGGLPSSLRERFNISTSPFRGCMKNVKNPSTASVTFDQTVGVSKKCSDDWKLVRSAAFSRNGILTLNAQGFPYPSDFQVGFGFRSLTPSGRLLYYNLWNNILEVYLKDGFIVVSMADKEKQSNAKYEAGLMHYVSVIKTGDNLKLLFDDQPVLMTVEPQGTHRLSQPIQLGGDNFEGCISNVFIQRTDHLPQVQNLVNYTEKTRGVLVGTCSTYKQRQPLMVKDLAVLNGYRMFKLHKEKHLAYMTDTEVQQDQQSCVSPTQLNVIKGAYQFGNTPNSFLLYTLSQPSLLDGSHFSVEVQTAPSGGLIFFMGDKPESPYMSLHISKGRFVFSFGAGGKKIKIKSKAKYHDGQWHTVVFSKDGKNGRLVIDGLHARQGSLAGDSTFSSNSVIYLGGIPSLKPQSIPRNSFVGCLRNFKMNGKLMDTAHQNSGVPPCLNGSLETGIYFFNEGGHIKIDNSFVIGLEFKIIFNVRLRSLTGVLLHSGSKQDSYLAVYMEAGKLTASGKNGAREFKTSVTLEQSLCDGEWHSISVTQKQNIVQLQVDTKSNYTVGSSASLSKHMGHPLYFGGLPANLKTPWLPVQDSFTGCVKNININNKSVSVSKMSDVHGVVSLRGCPVT